MKNFSLTMYILITFILFSCMPDLSKDLTVTALPDRDKDNIPDTVESANGTDGSAIDTDGDGLGDYEELQKYKTNPLVADSDGDGISDSHWDERREYTVTLAAVVDLRPPFDLAAMNDFYQDARILSVSGGLEQVTRVEVILYPEAKPLYNIPGSQQDAAGDFQKPTYAKNYNDKMVKKARALRKPAKHDYQAVGNIIQFANDLKSLELEEFGYPTDLPIMFNVYKDNAGNYALAGLPENVSDEVVNTTLDRFYFADSMFRYKTSGSCGPRAIIRGAMLRAGGFQERTTFAIPLIYWYKSDNTNIEVSETYKKCAKEDRSGSAVADHLYNEVLLGNQWIRVDYKIDTGVRVFDRAPYIKILTMDTLGDYNFPLYWNYNTWREKRPFTYISVIEQQPLHKK